MHCLNSGILQINYIHNKIKENYSMIKKWIKYRHGLINKKNRLRLTNKTPTLICSNCTGGVLYHWLGLEFRSPFINLYMNNIDFIKALENFDEFLATEIVEDKNSKLDYPVGIGYNGVRLHFVHYKNFTDAIEKWNERKKRIDPKNMCVWLTNFTPSQYGAEPTTIIERFNKLPFKNKLIFSGEKFHGENIIYLKKYNKVMNKKNIFGTMNFLGKRFIDQFDYVSYLNNMIGNEVD